MNRPYNSSFPSGYVEVDMDSPEDGLNGECIAHFGGSHSNDELVVTLVNGIREGKAILFHDGLPVLKYEYSNGVLTGNVKTMKEWERLLFIVSKGIDSESCLFSYDIGIGYSYGVMKYNNRYYVVDWFRGTYSIVIADVNRKEMTVCSQGKRIDSQYSKDVVDLNVNGRRWEGGVKDGKPFGYGVLYDEEGRKEYEGFMMEGMKVCYGIEFSNDTEGMRYRGCFYDDKRCGKGVLCNQIGMVEYNGLWKNDNPASSHFDGKTIDSNTESIEINNNSFGEVYSCVLPFFFHSLKRIVIGDNCFGQVRLFELNGLGGLESIVIGKECFRIGEDERSDGSCRIVNCPKLKSIQIGDKSYYDYLSFELSNLPSLQSIITGEWCFRWAPSFSLTSSIDGLV